MKKVLILLNLIGIIACSNAQVGINTSTPSTQAALDINSQISPTVYGGFLPPRVTLTQRDAMAVTAADDGLIVYVTLADGSRCLQLYNGATLAWESIQCFNAAPTTPQVAFLETMGTAPSTTLVNAHHAANGFANSATCTFSSSSSTQADIRNTVPSNTTGASGLGNLFITSGGTRNFLIQNINVSTYTAPLTLQMLIYKGTNASNGSELTIEYYNNATSSWVTVTTSSLATGAGTGAVWYEKVLSTTVPNTIQQIRISTTGTNPEFRIDDIKIIKP